MCREIDHWIAEKGTQNEIEFLWTNVTHLEVEKAGNKIFILDEDKSHDELIDIEDIWKDTFLSNLFIFYILIFMSYNYVEESF